MYDLNDVYDVQFITIACNGFKNVMMFSRHLG